LVVYVRNGTHTSPIMCVCVCVCVCVVWCVWCVCDAYVCVHENVHTYMYMCTIRTCACSERMRAGVCERTRKSESKRKSQRGTKSKRVSERAREKSEREREKIA
jgi:hypothetical protein